MPDSRRARCRLCRKHRSEVGPISWGGYCATCGPVVFVDNVDGLHYKRGFPLLRWRRGMAASVGAVLPEDS